MSTRLTTIVIDPGHGGDAPDGGSSPNNATGPNGLLEKSLTLDLARRVQALLPDAQVILTRNSDANLSLTERAHIARDSAADLFLSIHLNGLNNPQADGSEVWVARQASDRSRHFAQSVLDRIVWVTKVANRGVREADLGVLLPSRHAPDTGVCLVEVAFLTNSAQAERLADETYRQRLAGALANALRSHTGLPIPGPSVAVATGGNGTSSHTSYDGRASGPFEYDNALSASLGGRVELSPKEEIYCDDLTRQRRTEKLQWEAVRQQMVQIAKEEFYYTWHSGADKETDPAKRSVVENYWRQGAYTGATMPDNIEIPKTAWSAAFIAWVVNQAGGNKYFSKVDDEQAIQDKFTPAAHFRYFAPARTNRQNASWKNPFWAYQIDETRPQPGDILIRSREDSRATYVTAFDIQHVPKTHGEIVVDVGADNVTVIGGNAGPRSNTVSQSTVPLNAEGYVTSTGGAHNDHFAIIRINTDVFDRSSCSAASPALWGSQRYAGLNDSGPETFGASDAHTLSTRIRFVLGHSVGRGGDNKTDDILALKDRLIELGFDWLTSTHRIEADTINAINLVQSIISGSSTVAGDGRVSVPGPTYRWLQAANAPRWQLMPAGSRAEGFFNAELVDTADHHDFGTDWLADTIRSAAAKYRDHYLSGHAGAALLTVNDVSLPRGGDTPDHATHETGMACDLKLPRTDGSAGGITWRDALHDRNAARGIIQSLRAQPLFARAFFNDTTLTGEGLCTAVSGHDDHIHFEIHPPKQGGIELIDVRDTEAASLSYARTGDDSAPSRYKQGGASGGYGVSVYAHRAPTVGSALGTLSRKLYGSAMKEGDISACTSKAVPAGRATDDCPLLTSPGSKKPNLVLHWNDIPSGTCELDIVVHFHGWAVEELLFDKAKKKIALADMTAETKEPFSGLDLSSPAGVKPTVTRSRPTLAILPLGRYTKNVNNDAHPRAYDHPFFANNADGLQKLIDYSLNYFAKQKMGLASGAGITRRRLILTAHSGGGAVVSAILDMKKPDPTKSAPKQDPKGESKQQPKPQLVRVYDPDEVHLFDAVYSGHNAIVNWANERIGRDSLSLPPAGARRDSHMRTSGGALRVFYGNCGPDDTKVVGGQKIPYSQTETGSRKVHMGIRSALKSEPFLQDWYRVERTGLEHNQIAPQFGYQLLVNASDNVVDAKGKSAATAPPGDCVKPACDADWLKDQCAPKAKDPKAGARSLAAPSRDEIVREMDRQLGTTYGDYDGYVRSAVASGTLFGKSIEGGVRPEFVRKLQQGERQAALLIHPDGSPVSAAEWGVETLSGFQRRPGRGGWHPWGLAVDLNYLACPYIIHESGESALDRLLEAVYHRIARMMLRRDSVIPTEITQGSPDASRTNRLYATLREESDCMIGYFALMQDRERLEQYMQRTPDKSIWSSIVGDGVTPTVDNLQQVMMRDYVTLSGRSGPQIPGLTYPSPATVVRGVSGDPPFFVSGGGTHPSQAYVRAIQRRAPEQGFLTIRKEIVLGMSSAGLRWGAIDFGASSGDVMHFDDGNGAIAAGINRAKQATSRPS